MTKNEQSKGNRSEDDSKGSDFDEKLGLLMFIVQGQPKETLRQDDKENAFNQQNLMV